MSRRPERFALFVLLVAGSLATAYFLVTAEANLRARQAGTADTRALVEQVRLSLLEVRAGQKAYIAQGQDADEWMGRVAEELERLSASLEGLAGHARTVDTARVDVEAAHTAEDAFIVIDRRVREYVEGRNPLPASDLIFEDGMRTAAAIDAHVVSARQALERAALELDHTERQTMGAILGAWLLGTLLIAFLLLRLAPAERAEPAPGASPETRPDPSTAERSGSIDDWFYVPPRESPAPHTDAPAAARPRQAAEPTSPRDGAPLQQVLPGVDLEIAAAVCTDLAQVRDAEQLAEVVGRAARLLDAAGLIVWTVDDAAAELRPLVIHGYSDAVVDEIPAIPYGADNVTAAAWRAEAARTVHATDTEPGGIAAPLLVNTGCVGVLTADIGHGREQDAATLALARIVAAQIAMLLPTPAAARSTAPTDAGIVSASRA